MRDTHFPNQMNDKNSIAEANRKKPALVGEFFSEMWS